MALKLSYKVDEAFLLKSASVPLQPGRVCLVTGVENSNLAILGGLLARLFPAEREELPPNLKALVRDFTGDLTVEEGTIPESSAYVGPDPDRHLVFAKVKEELLVQTGVIDHQGEVLAKFGLADFFLERRISRLSGGEKMKVALAIAFSAHYQCYVLHGVLPWLDKQGRDFLIDAIRAAKEEGSSIVLLQHAAHALRDVIDDVVIFDGTSTTGEDYSFSQTNAIGLSAREAAEVLSKRLRSQAREQAVLEARDVSLLTHPSSDFERINPLLQNVSFRIDEGGIYALVGHNGVGKSTIAQMAFGLIGPESGDLLCFDTSIRKLARKELIKRVCYLSQFPEKQITVANIDKAKKRLLKQGNRFALDFMEKWLPLPDSFPMASLSVLQMKILCLALFITIDTKLVILDEPTWGLDENGEGDIMKALRDISESASFGLLIISHNLSLVTALGARILWLDQGTVKEFESVFDSQFNHTARSDFGLIGEVAATA